MKGIARRGERGSCHLLPTATTWASSLVDTHVGAFSSEGPSGSGGGKKQWQQERKGAPLRHCLKECLLASSSEETQPIGRAGGREHPAATLECLECMHLARPWEPGQAILPGQITWPG